MKLNFVKMSIQSSSENPALSYKLLRKAIGVLGILFPVILPIGAFIGQFCEPYQSTISCYYHTDMRNIFEGVLWLVGTFLIFYRYEHVDNVLTTIAGICALGVALCPTYVGDCAPCGDSYNNEMVGYFHIGFAMLLFGLLAYISLHLFTKSHSDPSIQPTPQKLKRNRVYKTCGWIMVAAIILIAIYWQLPKDKMQSIAWLNPVFWLEAVALWAFGISWSVKGEMVLKDKE